jgi:hypothetical protein
MEEDISRIVISFASLPVAVTQVATVARIIWFTAARTRLGLEKVAAGQMPHIDRFGIRVAAFDRQAVARKLGAIGVLVKDDKGKIKTQKLGSRHTAAGAVHATDRAASNRPTPAASAAPTCGGTTYVV